MRLHIIDNIINKIKLKKLISGFSLIELMVVVAIIGILASIAVPAYDGYMVRSRLSHLINVAKDAKSAISEHRVVEGAFPDNIGQVFSVPEDPYYAKSTVTSTGFPTGCAGAVTSGVNTKNQLEYQFAIEGNGKVFPESEPTVYMRGVWVASTATTAASLNWTCKILFKQVAAISSKYIPAGCTAVFSTVPDGGVKCT